MHVLRILLIVASVGPVAWGWARAAVDPLLEEMEMLVGPNARACGLVPLGGAADVSWACAQDAEARGAPYWIAIERAGVDSEVWVAALRTPSGGRYILKYDSDYLGRGGRRPRLFKGAV